MPPDELLTIAEVAQELRFTRGTIYRFLREEKLFPETGAGPLRIRRSAITAYLNAQATPAVQPVRHQGPQRQKGRYAQPHEAQGSDEVLLAAGRDSQCRATDV